MQPLRSPDSGLRLTSKSVGRFSSARRTATAAVGVDGIERDDPLIDQWTASALFGLRYSL